MHRSTVKCFNMQSHLATKQTKHPTNSIGWQIFLGFKQHFSPGLSIIFQHPGDWLMNHHCITHPYPTNQSISIPPFHFQPLLPRFPTGISPLCHPVVPPVPYPVRWVPRVQPEANPRPHHGGGNTVSSWVFGIFFVERCPFFLGDFFNCCILLQCCVWDWLTWNFDFLCIRIHELSGHAAKVPAGVACQSKGGHPHSLLVIFEILGEEMGKCQGIYPEQTRYLIYVFNCIPRKLYLLELTCDV